MPHELRRRGNVVSLGHSAAGRLMLRPQFDTADELRNRAAKAAEEIDLRLRAQGFQLEAQPAPLNQEGER